MDPKAPYNGIIFGMFNVGRKLTRPMDCSRKTTKLMMAYVSKKKIVMIGATVLRSANSNVMTINTLDNIIANLGIPVLLRFRRISLPGRISFSAIDCSNLGADKKVERACE